MRVIGAISVVWVLCVALMSGQAGQAQAPQMAEEVFKNVRS